MAINLPDFDEVLANCDLEAIEAAIFTPKREGGSVPNYRIDDVQNIKEMLLLAGRRWLPGDLVELTDVEIEGKIESERMALKAYLDITAVVRGVRKPFDGYPGARMTIDWKTRDGELDQRWKDRNVDSWQWKIYSSISNGILFNYRGVSRRCNATEYPCKDILLLVPESVDLEVEEYVQGKIAERNSLIELGLTVWPRSMPDSCGMYGRECPFKGDCDAYSMPRYLPETSKIMSYTSLKNFGICPEKARRLENLPEGDSGDETNIGDGFHKAMAELYKQAFKLNVC